MTSNTNLITRKKTRKPAKPSKPSAEEVYAAAEAEIDAELAESAALKLELARVKQELAAAKGVAKNTIKVSKKGCVSVYGMGRYPISFYKTQWAKLFSMKDEIEAFIEQHKDALPDKKVAVKK